MAVINQPERKLAKRTSVQFLVVFVIVFFSKMRKNPATIFEFVNAFPTNSEISKTAFLIIAA